MKNNNPCDQSCDCDSVSPIEAVEISRRHFFIAAGAFAASATALPVFAGKAGDAYAKAIQSHDSLCGYWRFDGGLVDATGKADAEGEGRVSYIDGAMDGQALRLSPQGGVAVSDTSNLKGESGTVELFFKLTGKPSGESDAVIISQGNAQIVRFAVGVKNDLSALTFYEGRVPTTVYLPTEESVEVGRWYHLVVTSNILDLRVYVDGSECTLKGGALDFTRRPVKGDYSMTFGGGVESGDGPSPIAVSDVAYYNEGLSIEHIRKHLVAGGWEDRQAKVAQAAKRLKAGRRKTSDTQLRKMLIDKALQERGERVTYRDEYLDAISLTIGGLGAGAIQFNGHAEPEIWQIGTNHSQPRVPHSFLAIRSQVGEDVPVVRALQTRKVGPFAAMKSLSFEGEYPFGWYRFEEPKLPVEVELEVFNPLIPMDLKSSSIPCAIYTVTVKNPSQKTVSLDVLASQQNAVGFSVGTGEIEGRTFKGYGGNVNRVVADEGGTMLHMTGNAETNGDADMVLQTQATGASATASWGTLKGLHNEFSSSGQLSGDDQSGSSAESETVDGAISAPLSLAPGESKTITFTLAWNFPDVWHGQPRGDWRRAGNMYTNWWANAMETSRYLSRNLADLTVRTRQFHQTLYESNMPHWLIDRLSSQLAVLRSQTCWWSKDDYFGAWEGCSPDRGCCAGNCTHVWHYAQGHARIFPELGRKMREQDFDYQHDSGLTPFRHLYDREAADGHFGTILNAYREYQCCTDDAWLGKYWVNIKKAMEWGIKSWDPNSDGFLQNIQHNTLDGEMAGCSSWIGTLYLSALQAAAKMAELVGADEDAKRYLKIHRSGAKLQNEKLWNGEYYIQLPEERVEDYLDGCHIDQVLGEWWADQLSLERNYPRKRVRQALESLLEHNFYSNFHGQSLKPRQFVTDGDAGMKMITWPRGAQPIPGMKYGDEVMTGFEYGAGVSMIQNGMLNEGLMVIKAIYDRYDGRRRTEGITDMATGAWGYSGNPFGDDECGKFYGRSLSVWSVLLALQGFDYDGPAGRIGFKPCWQPEDHASFFTAAEGYGLFTQKQEAGRLNASIDLREGRLTLNEMILAEGDRKPKAVKVSSEGQAVNVSFSVNDGELKITLNQPVNLEAGQTLDIEVRTS